MKKMLMFLGLLAGFNAQAQLTEWVYGAVTAAPLEETGTGLAMRITGSGNLLSGHSVTSPTKLMLVKGNLNGTTTLPGFNKTYTMNLGGQAVFVKSSRVAELPGAFAIAGDYQATGPGQQNGIYYVNTGVNGVPAACRFYTIAAPSATLRLGNTYVENNGNVVYLTGTVLYNGGGSDFFVMKVDPLGGLVWSSVFDIPATSGVRNEAAYDLTLNTGGTNLAVVGAVSTNGGANDAFFMFVNATTGAAVGQAQFWGTANSTDEFHSIARTSGGNYLVTGKSNATASGDYDMWGIELTGIGTGAAWNRLYQYNGTVNPNNDGVSAVENTSVNEYYLIGTTDNGVLGQKDIYTIHTDNTGKVVASGQYTYGGSLDDVAASIDMISTSPITGEVYMFGNTKSFGALTPDKLYFIKTDLNGQISNTCNIDRRDGIMNNGPVFISSNNPALPINLLATDAFCGEDQLGVGVEICNNTLQTKLKGLDLQTQGSTMTEQPLIVSPNPVEPGASTVQLNVNAPAGQLEVIIADYMGRQYMNQRFDIRDGGAQTLSVELGKANLAPGLYLLKVNGLDKPASQVLIVK